MKEQTKPSEEQKEGELKEERKESSNLEHAPFLYPNVSMKLNLKLILRVVYVSRKILVKPLFHENTEGCGDESDDETE